jgi:arginyl-tRNA synthetase
MNVLQELRRRLEAALRPLVDDPAPFAEMVHPAQDPRFGDYQINCAMPLKGVLGRNPREIAAEIIARLDLTELSEEVPEIAGPGFINLTLRDDWIAARVGELIGDDRLGVESPPRRRKYVIDFSSPNVAKPMHVGHLRSTVLGDALCRILRFLGHEVISDNHIGDWGTQFGMIIYGYKHFLDSSAYRNDPVTELARLYRLVNQLEDYHAAKSSLADGEQRARELEAEYDRRKQAGEPGDKAAAKQLAKLESNLNQVRDHVSAARTTIAAIDGTPELGRLAAVHSDIAAQARQETAKLHAGDAENQALWKQFLPACLELLHGMYDRLGVSFDLELGESHYQPQLAGVVAELETKGLASESDGAVCVFVPGNEAPFIVRKQDGAFTYATTDLATIKYRVEQLGADDLLYVVDARQSEHFKLLFATARQWGFDRPNYRHVSFGTILGDDKRPYKTRSGDTVGLEGLIDEAVARAREIVNANDDGKPDGPELDDQTRGEIAEIVGIGGIKFADLKHNRESDYVFSWDKMLAKEGETATYIQYAHARVAGIFRKGNLERDAIRAAAGDASLVLVEPEERMLALRLLRFTETLAGVEDDYRPNLLTQYLFDTANAFSRFFDKCPVLKAESERLRTSRLLLCDLTARVFETGLSLLGIAAPARM